MKRIREQSVGGSVGATRPIGSEDPSNALLERRRVGEPAERGGLGDDRDHALRLLKAEVDR